MGTQDDVVEKGAEEKPKRKNYRREAELYLAKAEKLYYQMNSRSSQETQFEQVVKLASVAALLSLEDTLHDELDAIRHELDFIGQSTGAA